MFVISAGVIFSTISLFLPIQYYTFTLMALRLESEDIDIGIMIRILILVLNLNFNSLVAHSLLKSFDS